MVGLTKVNLFNLMFWVVNISDNPFSLFRDQDISSRTKSKTKLSNHNKGNKRRNSIPSEKEQKPMRKKAVVQNSNNSSRSADELTESDATIFGQIKSKKCSITEFMEGDLLDKIKNQNLARSKSLSLESLNQQIRIKYCKGLFW